MMNLHVLQQDNDGRWFFLDQPINTYASKREALMASQTHPVAEWEALAAPLMGQLNDLLTGRGAVNDHFEANDILSFVVAGLAADPTGKGPMLDPETLSPVGTWTCLQAVVRMALMADIEAFLGGNLGTIDGLPVPDIKRRIAIRRK